MTTRVAPGGAGPAIRARSDADIPGCARLAQAVHSADGYPRFPQADMTKFFALNGPYLAWVAERDACLVGHVALRTRPAGPVVDVASEALGQPAGRIGVVARLLVSPDARGARLADRRLSGH